MNTIITKKTLNQSINFFSELDLDDNDCETIYEKFKFLLENNEMEDIFRKISQMQKISTESDLKVIMKELITDLNLGEINALLTKIIKNEPLIDYIQDLFLEKLL